MKVKGEKFQLTIESTGEPLAIPNDRGLDRRIKEKFGFDASFNAAMTARKGQGKFDFDPTKQALIPKPEDFMLFPFRLISATIVGGGTWKATDFSNEKVLKKSVPMLSNKPAYKNHDLRIGSDIGSIGTCEWVSASEKVPGGIDGPYVIDSVLNGDLCRKMLSPTSPIQSSSVTVMFDWEASHEFENENDFYWHLGEMVDGSMVRRIVTNISDYVESSLVYLGADPYAKMKDKEGNYINIDRSSILSNSKFDDDILKDYYQSEKKYIIINSFVKENLLDLRKGFLLEDKNPTLELDIMFKTELAKHLNISEEELTIEKIKSFSFLPASEVETLKGKVTTLEASAITKETEVATLTASVETLTTERDSFKANAELGVSYIARLRKEAKESYSKTVGGKPVAAIEAEIEACADIATLEAKISMFHGKLITDFKCTCEACGSDKVSFRSSEPDGEKQPLYKRTVHLSEQI